MRLAEFWEEITQIQPNFYTVSAEPVEARPKVSTAVFDWGTPLATGQLRYRQAQG